MEELNAILDRAERKIQTLVRDEAGKLDVRPFDPAKADETAETVVRSPRRSAKGPEDDDPRV
jgi:hypothetical protein